MNIFDAIIILLILAAGVVGLKRGVFKELVMTVGLLIVFILAFKYKDFLADWMSLNLPFFDFPSPFKGMSVLNIIIYQSIAFIIVFSILMIAFRIILLITKIIEKILKFTIILGIPSKILGFIVGAIEGYIIVFFMLFIFKQSMIAKDVIETSRYTNKILNSSPVLTNVVKGMNKSLTNIYRLVSDADQKDVNELNRGTIDILLENKVVDIEYVTKLIDIGKLRISGIDTVLNKYR